MSTILDEINLENYWLEVTSNDIYYNEINSSPEMMEAINQCTNPQLATDILVKLFMSNNNSMHLNSLSSMIVNSKVSVFDFTQALEDLVDNKLISMLGSIIYSNYELDDDVKLHINHLYKTMPMIIKPKKLNSNFDKTLFSPKAKPECLLTHFKTNNDLNIDHINLVNSVAYTLDYDLATSTTMKFKSPEPENRIDAIVRKKLLIYTNFHLDLYKDKDIYFTWFYDKRGRFYDKSFYLKLQGNDYQVGIMNFKNQEYIED